MPACTYKFTHRGSWSADISFDFTGRTIVVEYDGAHRHMPRTKILVETSKSADLLDAGYLVVRLCEDDLPALAVRPTPPRTRR
jgi:predicted metal-dependent RNase